MRNAIVYFYSCTSKIDSYCWEHLLPCSNYLDIIQVVDSEEIEECSSSATSYGAGKDAGKETDYEHSSPVSTLESSFVSESCTDSMITYSGKSTSFFCMNTRIM